MRKFLFITASLFVSSPAWAVSCDEVANMLGVNVPEAIVIQTMKDSGATYTDADISCLQGKGVSAAVLTQARKMMVQAAPVHTAEAVVPTEPEPSGMSSDEDILGSRRSKSKKDQDLEDDLGDSSSGPDKLREAVKLIKARRPLGGTLTLFDLLQSGAYPEHEVQIYYYLGQGLAQLDMYHTAQYYFLASIKKGGPNSPYFAYALPKLVNVADITGNDTELHKLVKKVPPQSFPRAARNHLNYLIGVQSYQKDDLSAARQFFSQVSENSSQFLKAKYYEGVIYNKQEKLKAAARSFREVAQADNLELNPRQLAEVERLQQLSLLNIARIYYSIDKFEEAGKYYDQVDHSSVYWPEALFEVGYAHFWRNDLNTTLGKTLTVQSPFFNRDEFLPEATILQALAFFNLCEYDEVERTLLGFENTMRPIEQELSTFVKSYATSEGRTVADQAYDQYFGDRNPDSTVPKSIFDRALRNQDLASLVRHMDLMDDELAIIDAQKAAWRDGLGVHLRQIVEKDRRKYKRRAGLMLLSELSRTINYLRDLLTQSEIIRFEVVDAQRVDYQYKMQNTSLADSSSKLDLDFATAVEVIYWPFNGEFWEDELGYYRYTEQSSCN